MQPTQKTGLHIVAVVTAANHGFATLSHKPGQLKAEKNARGFKY